MVRLSTCKGDVRGSLRSGQGWSVGRGRQAAGGAVGVRLPFHDQNMAGRWLQFARASWSKPVALARVSVPES